MSSRTATAPQNVLRTGARIRRIPRSGMQPAQCDRVCEPLDVTRKNQTVLYNRNVKCIVVIFSALSLVLSSGGCARNIDNQEAAQKAVDDYFARKPEFRTMSARVQNVIFRGNEADATVMVTGQGRRPFHRDSHSLRPGTKVVRVGSERSFEKRHGGSRCPEWRPNAAGTSRRWSSR